MNDRIRAMFALNRPIQSGFIAAIGALITIVILLTNNPGWAVIVASLILPAIAIVELSRRDVFEEEPKWGAPAALGWGIVVGVVAGILAAAISAEWWVSGATLHVGAGGFGGKTADLAGRPGFGVLLLNGIVIPALAIAFTTLGPFALRRYPVFRNEVMDGVTLGVAAGCGLATGMTVVFVWPIIGGASSNGDTVADWTALLTGTLVTRPIIYGLAAGFVCTGIWHSSISKKSIDLTLPAAIGVGGAIIFSFGDLLIQPSGTRLELLWHGVIAVALVAAARILLTRIVNQDRATQAIISNRVVCPNCGASTPVGVFCALCGATLTSPMSTPVSEPIAEAQEPVADSIKQAQEAEDDSVIELPPPTSAG